MILLRIIITSLFIIGITISHSYSQNDSLEIDSIVIIKKEPIIIKQTIYLTDSTEHKKSQYKWWAGLQYAKQLNIQQNNLAAFSNYNQYGVQIGVQKNKLCFNTGISILKTSANTTYNQTFNLTGKKTYVVTDTLDTYIQTINGQDETSYVTQNRNVTEYYLYKKDSTTKGNINLNYLIIPFEIGYKLKWKKLSCTPLLGVNSAFLISSTNNFPQEIKDKIKTIAFYESIVIELGYPISQKIELAAGLKYYLSFQKNNSYLNTNQFSNFNISVKYFINN